MILSSYLSSVLNGVSAMEIAKECIEAVKEAGVEYDAIAFRGMSGALIAPIMAALEGKNLLMVRKDTEGSHADEMVEGELDPQRYIIVDDFIHSGRTMRLTRYEVEELTADNVLVGVITYLREEKFHLPEEIDAFDDDWRAEIDNDKEWGDGF